MNDGIIKLGTKEAKDFSFTEDKFSGDSYLWKEGNRIIISLIFSNHPGQGHFKNLIASIENKGYDVAVPTPFANMQNILNKWGFVPHYLKTEEVELWMRPATPLSNGSSVIKDK